MAGETGGGLVGVEVPYLDNAFLGARVEAVVCFVDGEGEDGRVVVDRVTEEGG